MQVSGNALLMGVAITLINIYMFILPTASISMAAPYSAPEPDPPFIDRDEDGDSAPQVKSQAPLSIREWTLHKTSDDLHPDGQEQQLMWLMNRARSNPAHEGYWLARTEAPNVEKAIKHFRVNLRILQDEFDAYDAKPPAAFDVRLYHAAVGHSLDLIRRDAQDHNGQFTHIDRSGFFFTRARGNVFSYTDDALYGHVAFNIDWGNDGGSGDGMQPDRGHRLAIMSIDGDYTNVGLASLPESNPGTQVGPFVVTGNFCKANTRKTDHYNRFLVGTVWQDANNNDQYDPGEGLAGITVMPDSGAYYAVTSNSGGYAFPIVSNGTYNVTFSGSGISPDVTRTASADRDESVLLDLKYTLGSGANQQAVTGRATEVAMTTANLNGTVFAKGRNTEYYFQYGPTTNYGTSTTVETVTADTDVTTIVSGLNSGTNYHFRLVATSNEGTSLGVDQTFETSTTLSPQSSSSGGGSGGCFMTTASMH